MLRGAVNVLYAIYSPFSLKTTVARPPKASHTPISVLFFAAPALFPDDVRLSFAQPLIRKTAAIKTQAKSNAMYSHKDDSDDELQQSVVKCAEEIKAKEEADRPEREHKEEEARIAKEKAAKKRKKTMAIVTPILVACIAFVIVLTTRIIPSQKLNKAITLIDSGDYKAAYILLDSLDYKNSKELQESIKPQYQIALLSEAEIGSNVFFGSYEQDNDTSNGKEDIEWIVLAKEGNKALVISQYALDCKQYNPSMSDITWETCSLREWLNGPFLNTFGVEERNSIVDTAVTADKNPSYSTSPGNDATDKVFLLSISEVNKYFSSDEARKCAPTDYAKAKGVWTSSSYPTGGRAACWWLRSPGGLSDHAALVLGGGSVDIYGRGVYNVLGGVRPALWIDLGSSGLESSTAGENLSS